jgi:O-antigen/teichoic acid export membrane protein
VSSVRANFFSNLAGTSAAAAILILVTPIYLRFLGPDAFGLFGVYITLTSIASLLDLGLTPALTREIARLSATNEGSRQICTTVRTLEVIYVGATILVFLVAFQLLPLLAIHWLKPSTLDLSTIQFCLHIMAVQLAIQLPLSFYTGGFIGLQRQGLMNALSSGMVAARAAVAVLLLVVFHADVATFFFWQAAATAIHLILMATVLWKILPHGVASFQFSSLQPVWRYAAGMIAITALSIVLTQMDKVILSRTLSLEHFGYYMLVWNMASLLIRPAALVFNAWLPRMTQLATLKSTKELGILYRKGAQLTNLLVVPVAIILAIFSNDILYVYTGNRQLADSSSMALTLLSIGSACNALMHVPYALTLAYGWTRFAIFQNILAALAIAPITYWASTQFGLSGGGVGWIMVNVAYVLFSPYLIHRKYLRPELVPWYRGNFTLYLRPNFTYIKKIMKI